MAWCIFGWRCDVDSPRVGVSCVPTFEPYVICHVKQTATRHARKADLRGRLGALARRGRRAKAKRKHRHGNCARGNADARQQKHVEAKFFFRSVEHRETFEHRLGIPLHINCRYTAGVLPLPLLGSESLEKGTHVTRKQSVSAAHAANATTPMVVLSAGTAPAATATKYAITELPQHTQVQMPAVQMSAVPDIELEYAQDLFTSTGVCTITCMHPSG